MLLLSIPLFASLVVTFVGRDHNSLLMDFVVGFRVVDFFRPGTLLCVQTRQGPAQWPALEVFR
jgi:hypothetical protein